MIRNVAVPTAVTIGLLAVWPATRSPLIDLETLAPASAAHLSHGVAYVVLAPFCNVLDALTLLSVAQTLVLIASLALVYIVWRLLRWHRHGARAARELRLGLRTLGALVAVYGVGILAPRPMARLTLDDPSDVAVDFHSHTNASHDGRPGFDAAANLAWHRAAGFDVAYITDHKSYDGAIAAARANPPRAGDGLVALSGIEFITHGVHIIALGATEHTDVWLHVDPRTEPAGHVPAYFRPPVLLQTIPDNLARMPTPDSAGRGVLGIELSDGAPRGIQQGQRDRGLILHLADSLDLAVVASSNNHGWGRTAVAWSVLRLPGWRGLTPDSLGWRIEAHIRTARRRAVRIIARVSPDPEGSAVLLASTLPTVIWNLVLTMSPAERLSWIVWTWIAAFMVAAAPRRRTAR